MPGRHEEWQDFLDTATQYHLHRIVCLAPDGEIEQTSPSYAAAIKNGTLGLPRECFPIADRGIPDDFQEYVEFVMHIAELLRSGERILVHCGAGIGRTGTFAIALLLALGVQRAQAERTVSSAGSCPETDEQRRLIDRVHESLSA
jgi:protein-tyrosine phosphatase